MLFAAVPNCMMSLCQRVGILPLLKYELLFNHTTTTRYGTPLHHNELLVVFSHLSRIYLFL